ncbi:MAG: DbpA RNA binding domain-containing protein [Treponema sp.]|nr:DbpA RNA binding domain-containing protein [Treponema sp.]
MSLQFDEEKTKKTIEHVLDTIRAEADPDLLDKYYRMFKKEVSLFHRSKVTAFLLMLCDQGKTLGPISNLSGGSNYTAKTAKGRKTVKNKDEGSRTEPQRYPLADEESKRLFFNVGRSRRVFPREILGLINTKTAIPKEDIGAIRILDNYSFVQVRDTVAEKIIEALNGCVFRGRTLTVNYAKSRKDEENSEYSDADEQSAYNDTPPDNDYD